MSFTILAVALPAFAAGLVAYTHHDDFVSGGFPEFEELDDKGFHIIPSELGDMGRSGNMSKGQRIAMLVRVQSFRCAESRCCRSHIHILVASKILEPGPCRIGGCRTKRMYRSARIRLLTNIMLESAFKNGYAFFSGTIFRSEYNIFGLLEESPGAAAAASCAAVAAAAAAAGAAAAAAATLVVAAAAAAFAAAAAAAAAACSAAAAAVEQDSWESQMRATLSQTNSLVLLLEENGNQIDIFLADKLCAVFFTPGDAGRRPG
jgi:hypothetical protein